MALVYNVNLPEVGARYIKLLGADIHLATFKENLENNPYYPSIFSLGQVYSSYYVDSDVYEMDFANLVQIQSPFIAFTRKPDGERIFMLIDAVSKDVVNYYDDNGKISQMRAGEFRVRYRGVVLLAELTDKTAGLNPEEALQDEKRKAIIKFAKYGSVISLYLLLTTSGLLDNGGNNVRSYLGLDVVCASGLLISLSLYLLKINKNMPWLKSVCGIGKKVSCDAVLQSVSSQIMGINWSIIGFCYFAGMLLFLLFPFISVNERLATAAIISIGAGAYIPYSIYYQWRVVKQWCTLCLCILAVLLANATIGLAVILNFSLHINNYPAWFLAVAIAVLTPVLIVNSITPLLEAQKSLRVYKSAYRRLQYHPEVFTAMLKNQTEIATGYERLGLTMGNPEAKNVIVKVCNPFCGPCAKAHGKIEELLQKKSDVKLRIVFAPTGGQQSPLVIRHLLSLARSGRDNVLHEALSAWYNGDKQYASFAKRFPVDLDPETLAEVNDMEQWCKKANITSTPTFFVNGYQLPYDYEVGELSLVL